MRALVKDLLHSLREACGRSGRPADDAEAQAALDVLAPGEKKALEAVLRGAPPARGLGPFAFVDLARGVPVEVAAARELAGYYALQAERDAFAAMAGQKPSRPPPVKSIPAPAAPTPRSAKRQKPRNDERMQELLGLFTYHRDAALVARALRVTLDELNRELDALKIRRKAYRITRGTDLDLLASRPVEGAKSLPSVRRRSPKAAAPAPAAPAPSGDQELLALLAELGPRRAALADKLALGEAAFLARVRAAGLEREFALRERDLVRGLWKRHHAAEERVAQELQTSVKGLRALIGERGLKRELDALQKKFRYAARDKRWPQERIEQILDNREELRALGVLEELETEVAARVRLLWSSLRGKPGARDELRRQLKLDAKAFSKLQQLLDLR